MSDPTRDPRVIDLSPSGLAQMVTVRIREYDGEQWISVNDLRADAALPTPPPSLDAAWAAAEAALPRNVTTSMQLSTMPRAFGGAIRAIAFRHPPNQNYEPIGVAVGDTPAAALLALAARLTDGGYEPGPG